MRTALNHHKSHNFRGLYTSLPEKIQRIADKNFSILKSNPYHPSLHLKQIKNFWSVRVGINYRALGIKKDNNIIWFWIGSHRDYDKT